ncbi:MAG: exodeoxyribonuclease VII large subunit [Clostridia bacterium]|nr:exodeoxyribonuclease VII large subunit [Clostridia bacterium]
MQTQDNAISVSTLCSYIKKIFDAEELLHNISVYGEVSDFKLVRGNAYFKLKDADSVLSCVFFGAIDEFKEGDKVIAVGSPNFYSKSGILNFNVIKIKPFGVGELYKQFLETKNRLEKEGLFSETHKKLAPKIIKTIGVVASETGAVIKDIINVSTRRDPSINIVLYPANVQGIYAESEIIAGIKFLENYAVDVIVVARGGGSFEDLSVFNSEKIARCVYECKKFIVSAVGHETDYTIIDFVSDLRAPTPSAAAELLTQKQTDKIDKCLNKFKEIESRVFDLIEDKFLFLQNSIKSLNSNIKYILENFEHKYGMLSLTLQKHDVGGILNKGFAYLEKNNKSVNYNNIEVGDEVKIIMKDGSLSATIKNKE